jgi:hypothetical protein
LTTAHAPIFGGLDRHQWDEVKRVMQKKGVLAKGTVLFTQLIVGFHSLRFEIDPSPIDAE